MKKLLSLLCLSVALGATASAHLIHEGFFELGGPLGSGDSEALWIDPSGNTTYLNKYDRDESAWENDGALGDTYFGIQNLTDDAAEVMWDLTGTGFQLSYVLIKSGQAYYSLFSVSADQVLSSGGWDAIFDDPSLRQGAGISHVSFFGQRAVVPDSGMTLALLGLGLTAVAFVRRRLI